jgi:hypothetical protein
MWLNNILVHLLDMDFLVHILAHLLEIAVHVLLVAMPPEALQDSNRRRC